MNTKNFSFLMLAFLGMSLNNAWSASFDCKKAKTAFEKFICASALLNEADTKMGEAYKAARSSIPLPGFVLATQKIFLSSYSECMKNAAGKFEVSSAAENRCVSIVKDRITELESYSKAQIYTDSVGQFSPDSAIVIMSYQEHGKRMIRIWGNWMPDAYDPKPFPEGHICDFSGTLSMAKNGGFVSDFSDESVIFRFSDKSVNISEFIICTPRTGVGPGEYMRIK